MEEPKDRIIVALDVPSVQEANQLICELASWVGMFKVGLEMITAGLHPEVIRIANSRETAVFLDGKFNDIPNTVGRAAWEAARLGVRMFNVMASAGIPAMQAAVANRRKSLVFAVTVLTSLGEGETHLIFGDPVKAKVLEFARNAKLAGVQGIICSPQELEFLRKHLELGGLQYATPGVRPEWAALGDQKRVMTPAEAIKAGADYLVIGRPITKPPQEIGGPVEAAKRIAEEIAEALAEKEQRITLHAA